MRTALATGDVTSAVTYFSDFSKESYRQQFTDLSASLPQIAAGMGNITMVKVVDNIAEYDMRDLIEGVTYSFYLLFVKGIDGVWKIRNFCELRKLLFIPNNTFNISDYIIILFLLDH